MMGGDGRSPGCHARPEPDVQLSFANERTFLAWERTALGLITAGLAITQLLPSFDFPGGRRLIGLPLIALGVVIASVSYWEWHRNQDAIRDAPSVAPLAPPARSWPSSCRWWRCSGSCS